MSEARDAEAGDIPRARMTATLSGHADAEQILLDAYRSGRIPHAWLIGGPRGIGKATLAFRLARFVLAHPDPRAPAVREAKSLQVPENNTVAHRVASQSHPDLFTLERTVGDNGKLRRFIEVDDVRRCVLFFGATAGEGGWRIAVVDSVDELNASGENALLKVLEEPPVRSLLLLISHAPGRVLPTIRSRCRRLTLHPLTPDQVAIAAAAAIGSSPTDRDVKEAAAIAEGSVSRALSFLEGRSLELRQLVVALLGKLPDLDMRALHALGEALAGADQATFATVMDTINGWLSAELARSANRKPRLLAIAEAWEKSNRAAAEAEAFNLDRKPLVFSMFGLLAEAARG